jgi:hypothetical protein
MEQTVDIHNFPYSGNAETLNSMLRKICGELDAHTLARDARFTNAFELSDMKGKSKFVKVTLSDFLPTKRFISWVKGEIDTSDPLIDNLVFRRNYMIEDENQEEVFGKLLADSRGGPMRLLFDHLRFCDVPRHHAEYLLKTEMQRSLENTPFMGKVAAVHLDEVYTQTLTDGKRKTSPIHYADPKARMRVFLTDVAAATVLNERSVRPNISLDEGAAVLTIEVPLQLLVPRALLESKSQTFIAEKDASALAQGAQYVPPRALRRIECIMKFSIQGGKEREVKGMSVSKIEDHLRGAFGGLSDNIAEIHLPRNDRNQVDFDGRKKSYVWIMDVSEQSNAHTTLHATFVNRLKEQRLLHDTSLFATIRHDSCEGGNNNHSLAAEFRTSTTPRPDRSNWKRPRNTTN